MIQSIIPKDEHNFTLFLLCVFCFVWHKTPLKIICVLSKHIKLESFMMRRFFCCSLNNATNMNNTLFSCGDFQKFYNISWHQIFWLGLRLLNTLSHWVPKYKLFHDYYYYHITIYLWYRERGNRESVVNIRNSDHMIFEIQYLFPHLPDSTWNFIWFWCLVNVWTYCFYLHLNGSYSRRLHITHCTLALIYTNGFGSIKYLYFKHFMQMWKSVKLIPYAILNSGQCKFYHFRSNVQNFS